MTYPRSHLVNAHQPGVYHCISRCVRRAWLCGVDPFSRRSFEHRKLWLESRILELSSLFAVDLFGYAVMSNHYHLVLKVDPERASAWSDQDVARRWCTLTRGNSPAQTDNPSLTQALASPERLATLRQRLGSLSWFMRYLNEPLARSANREDGVTGRFWEGRFKSMALLDDNAVLACMAYVDLNPVRAKLCEDITAAPHTAIGHRLRNPDGNGAPLAPLDALGSTLERYRALLEWTASVERGAVTPPTGQAHRALSRMGQTPDDWLGRVRVHRFKYRAYGALGLLHQYAAALGQRWLCGSKPGLAAPG